MADFGTIVSVFSDAEQTGTATTTPLTIASSTGLLASGVDYLVLYSAQCGKNLNFRTFLRLNAGGTKIAHVDSHRKGGPSDPSNMHSSARCQGYAIVAGDGINGLEFQVENDVAGGAHRWYAGTLAAIAIPLDKFTEDVDYFKNVSNSDTVQLTDAPTTFGDVISSTFNLPEAGDYLVLVSCEGAYNSSSVSAAMRMRFEVDGTDIAGTDAGGGEGYQIQAHSFTGQSWLGWSFARLMTLTAGNHAFKVRGASRTITTADFRRARIVVLRESTLGPMTTDSKTAKDSTTSSIYGNGVMPSLSVSPSGSEYAMIASTSMMNDTKDSEPNYRLRDTVSGNVAREDTGTYHVDACFGLACDNVPHSMVHLVTAGDDAAWRVERRIIGGGEMRSGVAADGVTNGRMELVFWDLAQPAIEVVTTEEKDRQTRGLANYLPSGRAFGAKNLPGSVTELLLRGLACELGRATNLVEELRQEVLPDETKLFVDEWEKALGIPDGCFPGTGTITERRRDVLAKLVSLGVQTADDFEDLAALFGLVVTVTGGSLHGTFPYTFPMILFPSEKAARHTIVVDSVLPTGLTFPYTFPIQFGDALTTLVKCLFERLKPANVDLLFTNL